MTVREDTAAYIAAIGAMSESSSRGFSKHDQRFTKITNISGYIEDNMVLAADDSFKLDLIRRMTGTSGAIVEFIKEFDGELRKLGDEWAAAWAKYVDGELSGDKYAEVILRVGPAMIDELGGFADTIETHTKPSEYEK